ncbi:MAG: hypothetical protein ACOVP1_00665 [Bacteroidia bacterium]
MRKTFLIMLILCLYLGELKASNKYFKKYHSSEIPPHRKGLAVSLSGGTLGAGIGIHKGLSPHFAIRASYFSGNLNQKAETSFGSDAVSLDANIKVGAVGLFLDMHPSKYSSFHFRTGLVYNFNNYQVDITPKGNQNYGFIEYTPAQVGTITFDIKGANYAPYLGIGFGRAIPKRRLGFGFDMGAFYHGDPITQLNCTGTFVPSNTPENQALLQKAFEGYNFYPFLNFNLSLLIIQSK